MKNRYSHFQSIWKGAIIFLLVASLQGCGFLGSDELLDTMRCGRAAFILDDSYLKNATSDYLDNVLSKNPKYQKGTSRDAMLLGQIVREEAEPEGTGTSIQFVLHKAEKWRDSSHCQMILKRQDAILKETITPYLVPLTVESDGLNCKKFQKQFFYSRHPFYAQYSDTLHAASLQSLANLVDTTRDFQKQFLTRLLQEGLGSELAASLAQNCKETTSLGDDLLSLDRAKALESQRTIDLKNLLANKRTVDDCGYLADFYCRSRLETQVLEEVITASKACDKRVVLHPDCPDSHLEMFSRSMAMTERPILQKIQVKLQAQLDKPGLGDPNFSMNLYQNAQPCERAMVDRGFSGEKFYKIARPKCEKETLEAMLQPTRDKLDQIERQLEPYSN